jgi:hypothetical protein
MIRRFKKALDNKNRYEKQIKNSYGLRLRCFCDSYKFSPYTHILWDSVKQYKAESEHIAKRIQSGRGMRSLFEICLDANFRTYGRANVSKDLNIELENHLMIKLMYFHSKYYGHFNTFLRVKLVNNDRYLPFYSHKWKAEYKRMYNSCKNSYKLIRPVREYIDKCLSKECNLYNMKTMQIYNYEHDVYISNEGNTENIYIVCLMTYKEKLRIVSYSYYTHSFYRGVSTSTEINKPRPEDIKLLSRCPYIDAIPQMEWLPNHQSFWNVDIRKNPYI